MSLSGRAYQAAIRPLLFQLSPERAHRLALTSLRWSAPWRLAGQGLGVRDSRLATEVAGLLLDNPIGLGPGLDKNATALGSLARLGFGYVVVGSITREPRTGNRPPRLARDVPRQAILNSLGLPSFGVAAAVRSLARARNLPVPVIASVAGFSSDELIELARAVEPHVDAVEIGLVCPNSTESERMRELEMFEAVARGVVAGRRRPVFIKLPSHHDPPTGVSVREMVRLATDIGLDGVSVSGSRTVPVPGFPSGRGSLAGRPVFDDALRITRDVSDWSAGRLPIRAAGGVFSGRQAAELLSAGAHAVELYAAFIYRGPGVAGEINRGLLAELDRRRLAAVTELHRVPTGAPEPAIAVP
jgi:dihydroorotate dehydrogenase